MSVRDLNPLSPGIVSGDGNSGGTESGGGGAGGGVRSRSATVTAATAGTATAAARASHYGTTGTAGGERSILGPTVMPKNLNALFGVSPSDIDKYSRVVFPVCFICFNMMYWVIYLHISKIMDSVANAA